MPTPTPDSLARLLAIRVHLRQLKAQLDALGVMVPLLPPDVVHTTLHDLMQTSTTWLLAQLAQDTDNSEAHREGRL